MKITVGEAIARWLVAQEIELDNGKTVPYFAGVMSIFGHGNALGFGDALFDLQDRITTFRGQNETGMGLAAVGYTKAQRRQRAMVVTTSVGPGAMNVVTAAGTAMANRLPMFILSGDTFNSRLPDPVLQQVEHFNEPSQSVNDAFKAVTRYWDRITSPTQILSSLPHAISTMLDPAACGPVFIGLPQDIQAESFECPDEFLARKVHRIPRPRADRCEIDRAATIILESKKPVIIAGGGVHYSLAESLLAEFAETHQIPVVETMAGKASLLHSHPTFVGPLGVTGSDGANQVVAEADLIIAIGTRLQDFTTGSWTLFGDTQILSINAARFDAGKHNSVPVVGDARESLAEIDLQIADYKTSSDWTKIARKHKAKIVDAIDSRRELKSELPTYAQVVIEANRVAGNFDHVLTAAGGLPGELNNNWLSKGIATFDCEYGFSCMGYEISGAWGAAIAQKEKAQGRVIAMSGDGSYLMLNSDIYSAVIHRHPMTLILCDNGGFAVISRLQTSHGADSFRTMLDEAPRVDFVQHAASLGAHAIRVNSVTELGRALNDTREHDGVVVIVIETAPNTWTEGGAWWEVGVPEISSKKSVQKSRKELEEKKKEQRRY
mgnify:FL=1